MSLETALARVAELDSVGAPSPAPPVEPGGNGAEFARVLREAGMTSALPASAAAAAAAATPFSAATPLPFTSFGSGGGAAAVAAAQGEIGQAEQPPGSNDSPRIAQYRAAVGGGVGPWCAYFVSWAAAQGGTPLGDDGRGFASVDALYAWAQGAGRAVPAAAGPPRPGDLIVWDEHVGIVEGVLPDGTVQTIEGNSSNQVARRTYPPGGGGAIGYVRVG